MKNHVPRGRWTDQPIAALLSDLKQRGLLESTLLLWASEFGRTPMMQGNNGRQHNAAGFTLWMAGGGVRPGLRLGAEHDTSPGLQVADPAGAAPDTFFDREWALAVMDRALQSLAADYGGADKAEQFTVLKPWLVGDTASLPQAEAAARLGLSESAIKVAIHRLRKRFRDVIRAEIAQTLGDPAEVDTELRYLVEVLAQG